MGTENNSESFWKTLGVCIVSSLLILLEILLLEPRLRRYLEVFFSWIVKI